MKNKFDIKFIIAIVLIILSVLSRFLSLPANFSPIMAVALFSGMIFANKKIALLIPISAMLISDIALGLHSTMFAVYLSFGLVVMLGINMKKPSVIGVMGNSILGAVIFFIVTNFAVWCAGWYGYSLESLGTCYLMAIPFFHNTLISSVLYSGLLFGGFYLANKLSLRRAEA
ncbi:MAG: hypothetical protein FWG85_00455 [Bacteroidetes bacterium]|nr:hypothetical protein [Bacteroidota bacterium]